MSIVLDIIIAIFLILGVIAGIRKGLIKTLVGFVGVVAVLMLSYYLKTPLANFLIDKLPFFDFAGSLAGLTALNILIYNIIAFIVVFIVLYCILNIVMAVTGFIDILLKFTVIWIIPSKIGGAILGFLESWVFVYLVIFVLLQFSFGTQLIKGSVLSSFILDHTPVIGTYLSNATEAAKDIYEKIDESVKDENKTTKELNIEILNIEIINGLITKEKANELLQTGKLRIDDVMIGKGIRKWLNI